MSKINVKKKSIQDLQDEGFKKMSAEEKLSLLDDFFKLGKELQKLNDRKKI
ncbi:MAG: hypothetical protein AAB464_00215 [Patescibacteria group bacterium]